MEKSKNRVLQFIGYINTGCYFLFYFFIVFSSIYLANINFKIDSDFRQFSLYLNSLEDKLDRQKEFSEYSKVDNQEDSINNPARFYSDDLAFRENRGYLNFGSGLLESRESNLPELKCNASFTFSFDQNIGTCLKSNKKIPTSYFITCNRSIPQVNKSSILRI
jgi:hypothetical protein